MRWSVPSPPEHDREWRPAFAWLPVECRGGEVVWLEWYHRRWIWDEQYHVFTRRGGRVNAVVILRGERNE
jgi:hypothetical protein